MKVKVKSWNAVAYWLWDVKDPDDICGICQSNFDGCCASCKEPGDSCPLLFGKCSHEFHLHCIMKWLQDNDGCPSCRRPWEEVEGTTIGSVTAARTAAEAS
ncbi:Anaphase-promoting complex subunit 11 [Kalmanozyma brasiliensis GHG001]|uniref:Anaphase-promoting complex subunit 11 n=1 Tax=Kalmanozyma brasiliensis (strain GHG001) TaxID=1365824 RepID=V5EUK3_KALBG|nr:Anaphase-promoting complex subunit 11 [Kalmanozyma brasiliensis GHG001]EST05814.1 Anaphase-promoting complex subunit 11 [Kalmanozyma brasiliensis GHG001]